MCGNWSPHASVHLGVRALGLQSCGHTLAFELTPLPAAAMPRHVREHRSELLICKQVVMRAEEIFRLVFDCELK